MEEKLTYPCYYCGAIATDKKSIKDEDGEWITVEVCEACAEMVDDGLVGDWNQEYV